MLLLLHRFPVPAYPLLTVPAGTFEQVGVVGALMHDGAAVESVTFGEFPVTFLNGTSEELNVF